MNKSCRFELTGTIYKYQSMGTVESHYFQYILDWRYITRIHLYIDTSLHKKICDPGNNVFSCEQPITYFKEERIIEQKPLGERLVRV